ncbi:DEAD/DEAH box helicase [Roseococcus sp. SYP-B2431]|uniref:DEAD/DEAH box helicase n=1 Tax=Roseococcus sp. SYP-B2431 TaxID=2496640 RepID=UPI00103BA6C4|nr:DEAD/DEAH box helicase [Roseococcus sp. SYP-B2431]TCH98542.1 DEAD/DEAH box helicase [Roseococcus sp. SYP-B2431]
MTTFAELNLNPLLLTALEQAGHTTPTPIQAQAIPPALQGRDILGIAQTGTGKTAAFALPILHLLAEGGGRPPRGGCRVLVLSPTRELASQIAESFKSYGRHMGFSVATVFGGVGHVPQQRALARGVDVLVATPGRLVDHMQTRHARLDMTEVLVLDEADQMLDQGFFPVINKIVAQVPKERRTMFFSATMPPAIAKLADVMLKEPVRVEVTPVATTAERVNQKVIILDGAAKRGVLAGILRAEGVGRVLIFARTKHGADKIVKSLEEDGLRANAIHGNKGQSQRERALAEFKAGRAPILVATDIAARGIDVPEVTHVIQHELPEVPETYVHRIGRTARAGASGQAIALVAPDEVGLLRAIERTTRQKIDSEDRRANPTIPLNDKATPTRPQRGRGGAPQQQHRQPKRDHGGHQGARSDHGDRHESRGPGRPAQEQRSFVKPMGDGGRKRPASPGNSSGRSFMARGR